MLGWAVMGWAGAKLLSSRDAKKLYTQAAAAALRVKEEFMTTVTSVRESAEDILADAKQINEKRAAEEAEEIIPDSAEA
jgi:uncharacterized protein (DUF1778 family)